MTRVSGEDKYAALTALADQVEAMVRSSGLPMVGFVLFMDHPSDHTLWKSESRYSIPNDEMKHVLTQLMEEF